MANRVLTTTESIAVSLVTTDGNPYPVMPQTSAPVGSGGTIMFLGDSNTFGSNGLYTGLVGGYPSYAVQTLRSMRSDFDVIASQVAISENSAGCSVPFNEGHPGDTLANLAAGIAGWIATAGEPSLVVLMAGTNDVTTGRTLTQMQADTRALVGAIRGAAPAAFILFLGMPPFVDGTTTHASLAAWQALQASYVAWLAGYSASLGGSLFSSVAGQLGQGDFIADGVHLNQGGQGTLGQAVCDPINLVLGPVPTPAQPPLPRVFRTRQPWASEQCVTAATDGLSCTGHAGFNPGSGDFTFALDFYPTTVGAGTTTIAEWGSYAVNNHWSLLRVANAVRLYWMNTAVTIGSAATSQFGESPGLIVNAWHRIVIMAQASTGIVALYVNGQLAGIATGIGPWSSTAQVMTLGLGNSFGAGAQGYYSRVYAAKAVPARPGSLAALLAVESDYYEARSLCPGQGSASFTLDGLLTDDVYPPGDPNPPFEVVGSMAAISAYPAGTPIKPWDYSGRAAPLGPGI